LFLIAGGWRGGLVLVTSRRSLEFLFPVFKSVWFVGILSQNYLGTKSHLSKAEGMALISTKARHLYDVR
jgi:hypothetical protein